MQEEKIEKQLTGIAGEFFVAAELAKRNFQVSTSLGNAKGIDLFALSQTSDTPFQIEVKTLRKRNCFSLKASRIKPTFTYIFVYLNVTDQNPHHFILSGRELLENLPHYYGASLDSVRETVNHGPLQPHAGRWDKLIGKP